MKPTAAALWLALAGAAGIARAETIVIDDQVSVRPTDQATPTRGQSMAAVEKRFGEPAEKHAAVGKPPITRWDYPGFSVFFEYQLVIHAVATAP